METVQSWFTGLTCCNNLVAKEAKSVEEAPLAFTITCFDEADTELRDVRVHPTHQWKDMQVIITEIYGSPAMFAYDDGTGVDYPVRNQKEWGKFLDILMTEKACNGEYDILLLPMNGWERYNEQQQGPRQNGSAERADGHASGAENGAPKLASADSASAASQRVDGALVSGEVEQIIANLAADKLIDPEEEGKVKALVASSSPGVLAALDGYRTSRDSKDLATALKACL